MIYIRDKFYFCFLILLSCYLIYRLNNMMLYYYVDHIMIYILLLVCHVRIFCSSFFCMSIYRLSCYASSCSLSYRYVLVDGKFMMDKKSLNCKFRGSTNQRLIDVKKSLEAGGVVLYDV